jgi:segregation and condensation protein B
MDDLKNIIESLLFVAEEPLGPERIKKLVGPVEASEIHQALAALQADYDSRRGGFFLSEVAGGFQFRTRPEYTAWIRRLVDPKPVRLSKAALETLAIIAYKQPVIRTDVEHIRGVDCGGVLRQLLERKLIRVLGRKEIAGRPLIYATTKRFLETFDLKDLKDLPTPKEVEEFGKPPLEERGYVTIEPDEETEPAAEPLAGPPAQPPEEGMPTGDAAAPADGWDEPAETKAASPPEESGTSEDEQPRDAAEGIPDEDARANETSLSDGMNAEVPSEKKLDFGPERT